jgi:hypothetical protein
MKKLFCIVVFAMLSVLSSCKSSDEGNTIAPIDDGPCAATLDTEVQCQYMLSDCDGEKLSKSVQCLGIAKTTGERCKNKTTNPCGYCKSHKDQYPSTSQCPNMTKNACGYCDTHKDNYSE